MKHIDKLFKEKLYNHEAVVPEGMWEKVAPIAEEESGRAILWFWLTGLLTLILGGYGIYKMVNTTTPNSPDPSTLVYQHDTEIQNDVAVDHSLSLRSSEPEVKDNTNTMMKNGITADELGESTDLSPIKKKKANQKSSPSNSSTDKSTASDASHASQSIGNTVESITNSEGVPANLVITKSYINKEGYVIKQTKLTDDARNEGSVYDVIINSEIKDLNAGALIRIIEPLEIIPLPAFQKPLKKKTPITVL